MAPVARRPCIYSEDGCGWQTPQCDQITTTIEATEYVKAHAAGCYYNPTAIEERQYRRQQEAEEIVRREEEIARREAAERRREEIATEERREQREYQRQQEE